MLMQAIYLIPTKLVHKQDMFLLSMVQQFLGSLQNTLVATFSNHSEILALHEANRECI